MKKYFFIALVFGLISFSYCEDQIETPGIKMEFAETQCSNPWDAFPKSDNYLLIVHKYLNDNGIEIYSISIELINGGNGVYCDACNCPSGRKIVIQIPETDIEAAKQVGFTLVQ
jgi:hypothetical protein